MRYSDIVKRPEAAMRSWLEFLTEPYVPQRPEPLAQRINGSNVSTDFDSSNPTTNRAVVEQRGN